jgi:hypothetical protein
MRKNEAEVKIIRVTRGHKILHEQEERKEEKIITNYSPFVQKIREKRRRKKKSFSLLFKK